MDTHPSLPPCLLAADRIQRGASYVAHRLRGDGQGMEQAAEAIGDWEEAAYAFLEVASAALRKIADLEGIEPDEAAVRMSMDATFLMAHRSA